MHRLAILLAVQVILQAQSYEDKLSTALLESMRPTVVQRSIGPPLLDRPPGAALPVDVVITVERGADVGVVESLILSSGGAELLLSGRVIFARLTLERIQDIARHSFVQSIDLDHSPEVFPVTVTAAQARTPVRTQSLKGGGVVIAILDRHFGGLDRAIRRRLLPAPSDGIIPPPCTSGGDCYHGTAVAEGAWAMAPRAGLLYRSVRNTREFLYAARDLMTRKPDVINISLSFPSAVGEHAFEINNAINSLVCRGITVVTSAGNHRGRQLELSPGLPRYEIEFGANAPGHVWLRCEEERSAAPFCVGQSRVRFDIVFPGGRRSGEVRLPAAEITLPASARAGTIILESEAVRKASSVILSVVGGGGVESLAPKDRTHASAPPPSRTLLPPASSEAITVGATDQKGDARSYSAIGNGKPWLWATDGYLSVSTGRGFYGTSAAAPRVAGAAAVVLSEAISRNETFDQTIVEDVLARVAKPRGKAGVCAIEPSGDLGRALNQVLRSQANRVGQKPSRCANHP